MNQDKILFIVGCGRSGTTWLQLLLACHPLIASTRETYLFSGYLAKLWERWQYEKERKEYAKVGISHLVNEAEFFDLMREFSDSVLSKLSQDKNQFVLDKTPNNIFFVDLIKKLYPGAKIIHLVRDPRAVVASMNAASKSWGSYWAPSGTIGAALQWKRAIDEAKRLKSEHEIFEVSYEQLKDNTVKVLDEIFQWLHIPAQSEELKDYVDKSSIDNIQKQSSDILPSNDSKNFARKGTIDSWKSDLSHSQIVCIEQVLHEPMLEYGYLPSTNSFSKNSKKYLAYKLLGEVRDVVNYRLNKFIKRM